MKNKRSILLIVFIVVDICLVILIVNVERITNGDFFRVRDDTTSLEYTAEEGDTITSIALKYSVSAPELAKSNNLHGAVQAGQILKISTQTSGRYIKVKEGDTLESIAYEHWTDVETLKKLNSLSSDEIEPGMKLFVPEASMLM